MSLLHYYVEEHLCKVLQRDCVVVILNHWQYVFDAWMMQRQSVIPGGKREASREKAKGTLVSERSDALCGVDDATWSYPLQLPFSSSRYSLAIVTSQNYISHPQVHNAVRASAACIQHPTSISGTPDAQSTLPPLHSRLERHHILINQNDRLLEAKGP